MRKRMLAALAAALLLASCAEQIKMVWVRTDGQTMRSNPALAQQFEIDRTICAGETSKANMAGTQLCRNSTDCLIASLERQEGAKTVAQGCMAQKGYLNVPEDQAEAKAAELRALQPPPPVTTGSRSASAPRR